MTGATEFQFGVSVSGTLEQRIEQMEREVRLLRFARDDFPALTAKMSYSGTNRPMSQCLKDLSKMAGTPIPMEFGTNDFKTREFVFNKIALVDILKYLVAFDDAILDVRGIKLVCKPVRQALKLDESEYNLLHSMARQRFREAERLLAHWNSGVEKIANQDGDTLLHLAAWKNQTGIAKRLLTLGANVNARNNAGFTPLHTAVRDGNAECAELLLNSGADVKIPDNNESTPLQTAIYFNYVKIAKSLVEHRAPIDIFTASGLGMADQVKKLLDEGVDYRKLQAEYLRERIPAGSNIGVSLGHPMYRVPGSYMGISSVSPLHWAARGGSVEVVALLVSRGESVSLRDSQRESPLFWAVKGGKSNAVELLIKSGADVNATNFFGTTPLLTAARETSIPELTRLLINAGANVNARNSSGENALHQLAHFGYPKSNIETAQMLLEAGADITARNEDGKTPLDILLDNSYRNPGLVKLYRKYSDLKTVKD